MNIDEQFNLIAKEYDVNRKRFIPCFDDFYEETTHFVTSNITEPKRILDLGAGTGLLSTFWYKYFPKSEYVLIDIAEEMLDVARKRFAGLKNVSYQILDYSQRLPKGEFDVITSALSIHHLEHRDKKELFSRIYDKLPKGGLFINYDQFCAGSMEMNIWFDSFWENQLRESGLSKVDLERWQERRKLDRECSVEDEIGMLQKSNFREVKCIYSNQKFSVIVAIK
ncbi:class I SAM-dependent methyltransferase [Clostridium bornimense]|nr:class I SAM-dependent methyltransferase [Clostridium bornimense]